MNEKIKIRRLRFSDIKKIKKLYNRSSDNLKKLFAPSILVSKLIYPLFCIAILFHSNKIKVIIAEINREVVGFAYITKFRKKGFGMMTKEGYQGKGIGKKILKEILKGEKGVYLSVDIENPAAINLYKKYGFSEIGRYIRMYRE
ncbi:GNAT family N-acetyltransferase [Candidatus Pacearchaeota archaeon]|nr:GNAT family N-acetyltransferase [Candidatus Pacearchaeota archaeon]